MPKPKPYNDKLYEVLYENRPPTTLECASLRDGVDTITQKIAQLREELEYLEDQLQRHHSALTVVRRIPVEILGVIFGMTTWDEDCGIINPKQLVSLTLVCKTWLNAAYTSPFLWSNLRIFHPRLTTEIYEGVERWFGRSKGSSKTLRVEKRLLVLATNPVLHKGSVMA